MKGVREKSFKYDYLWVCPAFLFVVAMTIAANANGLIGVTADHLSTRIFNKDDSIIAEVQADRMYSDHDRWGFFRIGVMPKLVFENVTIQVRSAEALTDALANLQTREVSTAISQRLELKNVEIKLIGETQSRLSAATARVLKMNEIEFVSVCLHQPGGQPKFIPKAIMNLSSGKLCWDSNGKAAEAIVFGAQSK